MKKSKFILVLASSMLLASCGHRVLNSDEISAYIESSNSSQPTISSSSSEPSVASSESTEPPVVSSESSEPPVVSSQSSEESVVSSQSSEESVVSSESVESIESSESSSEEESVIYFREASWWNSATGVLLVSFDGAGVSGVDPSYVLDYDLLVPATYVSTLRLSAKEYINYWSIDMTGYEEATTIQFFRCGPKYVDDLPTEEIEFWGAQTVPVALSEKGPHDMYDISGCNKPAAWQEGAAAGASRSVTGVWGTYDPSSDVPYVPSSSEQGGGEASSSAQQGEVTVKFTINYGTSQGQAVYISGDFNSWDITTTYRLTWSDDNNWFIDFTGTVGETIEFKFVIANYDSPDKTAQGNRWEANPNRTYTFSSEETAKTFTWQA